MTDKFTPQQRSKIMSKIRSRNTRPELIVRRYLWHAGYRYRLCDRRLPGRPDIVIRRLKVAIFVNGCFWHGHKSHVRSLPQSNEEYWRKKITDNQARDLENGIRLRRMGWTVITIWECELTPRRKERTLEKLAETLRLLSGSGYRYAQAEEYRIAAEPSASYNTDT